MSTIAELREKRAKAHAFAVGCLAQKQTTETRAAMEKAFAEVDSLAVEIQKMEKAARGQSVYELNDRMNPWTSPNEVRKAIAFGTFLRKGRAGMTAEERNLIEYRDVTEGNLISQIGTYTGLGFFVPAGFVYDLENALKYYAPLADGDVITVMDTSTGQPLPYPTSNDTTQEAQIVGEGVTVNEQDIGAGHINFGAWKYSSGLIRASLELMQDSAFNLESWLSERMAIRFGRGIERDLTNGSGNNAPTGLLTAIAASGAVPVIAQGSSESSGGTETGANSIGNTDLVKLVHSVDPAYRQGGKFMLHDTTLGYLKRILDKFGRPLWTPGLKDGAPDTVLGYPYVINQHFPQLGASNVVAAFGSLKKYILRRAMKPWVVRLDERYADSGEVGFIGFMRIDAQLVDAGTHPINVLQCHS